MTDRNWWLYVHRIAGPGDQKAIAKLSGFSESMISRWKSGTSAPRREQVVRFARQFDRPLVEALIAAGLLEKNDLEDISIEVITSPDKWDTSVLFDELRSRYDQLHERTIALEAQLREKGEIK